MSATTIDAMTRADRRRTWAALRALPEGTELERAALGRLADIVARALEIREREGARSGVARFGRSKMPEGGRTRDGWRGAGELARRRCRYPSRPSSALCLY